MCYRCGTATALPASQGRPGGVARRPSLLLPVVLLLVALAAVWLAFWGTRDLMVHLAAVAVAIVTAVWGVVLLVRRRR